uniref:Uncharacterized protein n=1 Tax=Branchiostoma floridae TaxID=7739 RepID=C3ZHS5_BRAFL|eukprot:XP_002591858.1 hypothetical protein BRAFLDRAFT_89371 [Branchiostoma floridae]
MLQTCKKLVDVKSKGLGLVGTETDYLRALLDAMANMDRCVEVEVLKTLGDVNLDKGRLGKNPEKFERAMVLYRTALLRCEDADVGEILEYRYRYAEKLRLRKQPNASSSYEPLTGDKKMSSLSIAEKLLHLDRKLTVVGKKETLLLIEYTKLVVEGIVNGDTMLETEALKSLGDVYLKRGTRTKDSTNLTKATALYNTALSRCEGFQGKVVLIHRLKYTARIRQESTRIQKKRYALALEAIDQQHNPYQYDEDDPAMITVEAERAEAVKVLLKNIAKDRQSFIHDLVDECTDALGPPPSLTDAGSDNIKRSEILRELGFFWVFFGDATKGISLLEESLSICKSTNWYNTAHPDIVASLYHELGWSWGELGDHKKAVSFYERSLSIMNAIYGDNKSHPGIASLLNNLGLSWSQLGDQNEAIRCYEKSLRMMKTIYGDNTAHPHIAESLDNLGVSWRILGDQKKAITYFEQSLTTRKTIYGDNTAHPNIAKSFGNLGAAWSKLGNGKKAISYCEQSLAMMKTIYGDNKAHPDIATSLNNLGSSWGDLGDRKKAISYLEQSLMMAKTIYGDNTAHPDIAGPLHNLGLCLNELGDHKKAISYYEQSLSMTKTIYGNNTAHPDIIASLNNLGSSWGELGDRKKAISYFEQSLMMAKTIYGDNTAHPDIAGPLHNLGLCLNELGDHKEAISYIEQSLTMRKTINGDTTAHPDIAAALNSL